MFGVCSKVTAILANESCCVRTALLTLLALGALSAIILAYKTLNCVLSSFGGKAVKKYGKWAVVTGATDGIGLGYAKCLAKAGMNVALLSRSQDKLDETAKALREKYPKVEFRTIQADFSLGKELYPRLAEELKGMEIGVLINNVGKSYDHAEFLHLLSDKDVDDIINLNVLSTTHMTRLVLPQMIERKKGAIINVASAAGVIPVGDPLYTVYSATKAYVDFFSRSLHYELKGKGVFVQCQVPYFVVSKLSKLRKSDLFTPKPEAYAAAAVAHIGRGGPSVVPYWSHRLQHFVLTTFPTVLTSKIVLSHHFGIRARALKKKAKAASEKAQ